VQVADQNFTLVVFGASGSLAKLKIFPGVYHLALEGRLNDVDYQVVGYARSKMSNEKFREIFAEAVRAAVDNVDEKLLLKILERVHYYSGEYDDEDAYHKLAGWLPEIEEKKDRVRLVYFSVPPSVFSSIIHNVCTKLDTEFAKVRLILEKPFGYNYRTAKELEKELTSCYYEHHLYLLDHYLGKEAVFNVLSLRYANSILTTLIKGKHIANIQITAFEPGGIEGRAGYFEHVGTLRDMVQSHVFQILAFLVMSLPAQINEETLHREKRHVFEDFKVDDIEDSLVRGQYAGYLEEDGVASTSTTETFAALKLKIDNLRWHGVPIYLRTGKKMKQKWTAIVIEFKQHSLQEGAFEDLGTNKLVIQLQPQEKIEFKLYTKMGGTKIAFTELTTGRPIFCSGDCLHEHGRLLLEAIRGNRLLFLSFEEVFAAWKVIDPLLDAFAENKVKLEKYEVGGMGTKGADKLVSDDGFMWHNYFD